MDSHAEIMSVPVSATSTSSWKQQLFTVCFLAASAVATPGWLAALSWATLSLAGWLFF
jgi:hypothetical protein